MPRYFRRQKPSKEAGGYLVGRYKGTNNPYPKLNPNWQPISTPHN